MKTSYPSHWIFGSLASPAKRSRCRRIISVSLIAVLLALWTPFSMAASRPAKVTIHTPSKSLSLMPFYFGKDKGFFPKEVIELQLVMMGPPTAIVALVGGELDFSTALGAATSAIMQ